MKENKEKVDNQENDLKNEEVATENESKCEFDEKIQKLQDELADITDRFYRANADFENIKKRMEREKEVAKDYANEKFAKDLLPILDALEEAAKLDFSTNEFTMKIKDGLDNCIKIFLDTLKKHGVELVDTNTKFDANIHNAVQVVDSKDHQSGDIVDVYQKGYKYKDRLLRAPMVTIAK